MSIAKNCPTTLDCQCGANPFRNLSAELPDPPDFFAFDFFTAQVPLGAPDTFWGSTVGRDGCTDPDSQQNADDCAVRQAEEQVWDSWPENGRGGPAVPVYGNRQTQCSIACPAGFDPFIYTVPAGTVVARSQEEADALAASLCTYRGQRSKVCTPSKPSKFIPKALGFWDMGDGGNYPALFSVPKLSRLNGFATQRLFASSRLSVLIGGVATQNKDLNRSGPGMGVTASQAGQIVTASGAFFQPGDVGAALYWVALNVYYKILEYHTPTEVKVDTVQAVGAGSDLYVRSYTVGGTIQSAVFNSGGDLAVWEKIPGDTAIFYDAGSGQPVKIIAGSQAISMNDARYMNLFANSVYKRAADVTVGTGIVPGKQARGSKRILENNNNPIRTWNDGVLTNVYPLGGAGFASGKAISDGGVCVITTNAGRTWVTDEGGYTSEILAPAGYNIDSLAYAVNDSRRAVVSISDNATGLLEFPCYADGGGLVNIIPFLPGAHHGYSQWVNSLGWVCGIMGNDVNYNLLRKGWLWIAGDLYDLNDLLPASAVAAGYAIEAAYDMSDDGYIAGSARLGGVSKGFVLRLTTP